MDKWQLPVAPPPKPSKLESDELTDPIDWIQQNFYIPERKNENPPAIRLAPYQIAVLREAYRKDDNGKFVYSTVLWSDIKKSAKSSIAAAVALERAMRLDWGSIKIIANDLKQADSRVAAYLRRALTLNPKWEQNQYYRQSGYSVLLLEQQSRIEAIPIDPEGEAGGNDDLIIFSELWAAKHKAMEQMWCYDDQTEILTKQGWIKGIDLKPGDIVATVKPIEHILEWEQVDFVNKPQYSGIMHTYESTTNSQCVTPNHRLYGIFSHGAKNSPSVYQGIMTSEELRSSKYSVFYPLTSINGYIWSEPPEAIFFDKTKHKSAFSIKFLDWCEYLGWYMAEGRTKYNTNKSKGLRPASVLICQCPIANPEKWLELKNLHERIFGNNVGYSIKDNNTIFAVHSSEVSKLLGPLGDTYSKYIPNEIKEAPPKYLNVFFESFIKGDGHIQKNGSIQVNCGSKQLADDLSEIGLKLGYVVSVRLKFYNGMKNPCYRLLFSPKKDGYERILEKRKETWGECNYNGIVWCPSTKNGLVVIRRNGTVYVSGNSEMTLSPLKYGRSQRWIETYAGYSGESPILERLYEQGVTNGTKLDLSYDSHDLSDLEVYANGEMLTLWNTRPRLPWQTPEYYANEEITQLPTEFLRLHKNQWVSSVEKFVEILWWDSCRGTLPHLDKRTPVIIAMDAAEGRANEKSDCFAMVMVSRQGEIIYPHYVGIWQAEPGKYIDYAPVEAELRRLCAEYSVLEVAYDPTQLHDMATRLRSEGVAHFKRFNQGQDRLIADKQLRDLITQKHITHDGNPLLRQHIDNANAKNHGESGIRIIKRSNNLKIDAVIALSMAANRATYYNL